MSVSRPLWSSAAVTTTTNQYSENRKSSDRSDRMQRVPTTCRSVLLVPGANWGLTNRLLSVPGVAMLLAALFSLAYAESLLRVIRRRHAAVRPSELLGLIGTGAVAGVAVVLASWILSGRLLLTEAAMVVVGCCCAAIGLLVFGWESPVDTRRVKSMG